MCMATLIGCITNVLLCVACLQMEDTYEPPMMHNNNDEDVSVVMCVFCV